MSHFFIPDPCHENWDKMSPQEQGRHCAVCSKVVVDFTRKKEEEINHILSQATGKVCGHFRVDQLNQHAQMKVFRRPSNLFNKNWRYFALATIGFFAFNKKTEAQKLRGKVAPLRGDVMPAEQHNVNTSVTTLYGTVLTGQNKYARGAVVVVSSGGKEIARATVIANGSYQIKIQPGQMAGQKVDIVVNYSHTATKHIYDLSLTKASNRLNITLDEEMMLKGEIAYTKPPVKNTGTVVSQTPDTVVSCEPQDKNLQVKDSLQKFSILGQVIAVNRPAVTNPDTAATENTPVLVNPVKNEAPANEKNESTGIDTANLVVRPEDIVPTIYPNPAGTYATVYCNRQATYKVTVYDEKGALKMSKAFYGDRTELDVSGLARGNYFVNVRDDLDHSNTLKLVKQ